MNQIPKGLVRVPFRVGRWPLAVGLFISFSLWVGGWGEPTQRENEMNYRNTRIYQRAIEGVELSHLLGKGLPRGMG